MPSVALFTKPLLYLVLKETVGIETVTQKETTLVFDDLILINQERASG